MSDTGGILMKKEYYDFGRILDEHFKIKFTPRYSQKTIHEIYYLISCYLDTNTTQYLNSKFDFFKYSNYMEEQLNFIYGPESVKILYPCVLIKRNLCSKYEVAIFINWSTERHKQLYLEFIKP